MEPRTHIRTVTRGTQISPQSDDDVVCVVGGSPDPSGVLQSVDLEDLAGLIENLTTDLTGRADDELVRVLGCLEDLKNACSAGQARASVALRDLRLEGATTERERENAQRSAVSEIALARRESPHKARILLGLATVLTTELPETLAALSAGRISEWKATLVARETVFLDREHRLATDRELASGLDGWSDRELVVNARRIAYHLDPRAMVDHVARAESDRRVTLRPAPDCMSVLSALLPVQQGVAVYAALMRAVDSARACGDTRQRAQIMADTLVTRITGQESAPAVPVEVQVVITDEALLGDGDAPARLVGHGPIPAGVARALLTRPREGTGDGSTDAETRMWIRRLYAKPHTGQLVAMESRRRLFPSGLRAFIETRDANTCRTPWCSAPIAHIDHVTPARQGGPTSAVNGQGLCLHCNQAKEAPGWGARQEADGAVVLTTPTGRSYTTRPPPLPHELPPEEPDAGDPEVGDIEIGDPAAVDPDALRRAALQVQPHQREPAA